MPITHRIPNRVQFSCDACKREHAPRHIRRYRGECIECGGQSWTLVASYVDRELNAGSSLIGLLSFSTLGIGWTAHRSETIQDTFPNVASDVAYKICESTFDAKRRSAVYIVLRVEEDAARDREAMLEKGGAHCEACGILYMPRPDKPWTQAGCCSKGCYATRHPGDMVRAAPEQTQKLDAAKIILPFAVTCSCSHKFDVPRSYAGLNRPCPSCGAKVSVPAS